MTDKKPQAQKTETPAGAEEATVEAETPAKKPREVGGPAGPDPTRYGDWERKGIVSDF
jgi:hypothetical protein